MDFMFNDSTKINIFVQIQEHLCELESNAGDEKLNNILKLIPPSYLDQKDDLKIICLLFAYYSRNTLKTIVGNSIRLFEKIMPSLKSKLKGESVFLWNIFGGLNFYKQWMFEEGLITIETIVQSSINDSTLTIAEYFHPEIIENEPEIFEKKFKNVLQVPCTEEHINKFKELRKKYFRWLRESNDFNDPLYREIEKNQLRLSIKTDDVELFQSIISNSNLSINSGIKESVIENSYVDLSSTYSIIDYVLEFSATKIFKFLIMNDVKFNVQCTFNSIRNRNYEMIHIVKSKDEEKFKKYILTNAISSWNLEVANYALDNYDFEYLFEENIGSERDEELLNIIDSICYSIDFRFCETIFFPFLRKNPEFIKSNIHEILMNLLKDQTGYFLKEFSKYPGIDINYHSQNDRSILSKAILYKNSSAIKFLLDQPQIDLNSACYNYFPPFHLACSFGSYLEIIQIFCESKKLDINLKESRYNYTALDFCLPRGNFYALDYIIKNFPEREENITLDFIFNLLVKNYVICGKILLKCFLIENTKTSSNDILAEYKKCSSIYDEYDERVEKMLINILQELNAD